MKNRLLFCVCFLIFVNATLALDFILSPKNTIPLDSSVIVEGDRWVKKNPIAEHEFSDPIKAEKDRDLIDPGFFGAYHRAVINNMEYWVIAVSEIEVISIMTKPFTKIHFKVLYMGTWREITGSDHEYRRLLTECRKLDV